jgi:hypothetical protein
MIAFIFIEAARSKMAIISARCVLDAIPFRDGQSML